MKSLHLISAMYTSRGHGEEYIRNFTAYLGSHYNINLFVATKDHINDGGENFSVYRIPVEYRLTNAEYFLRFGFLGPYFRAISKQIASFRYYRKIINSNKIKTGDLVYIMDYDVIPLSYLVKSLHNIGTRTFLWVHSSRFKSKDVIYRGYKYLFKLVFNEIIARRVQTIIVNGHYIKNKLIATLKLKIRQIAVVQYPSQISYPQITKEEARLNLGFTVSSKIVLFFGMLRKDKNIKLLIKSLSLCNDDIKLIIAGSAASVSETDIKGWVKNYNLKNVHLDINYISEEKMSLYYSCSDALVLTYGIESGSQSGPLSLAREFGLPAIVTDSGELGYYVKTNGVGLVADENSAKSFSKAINKFFQLDETSLTQLQNKIKSAKDQNSWIVASTKYREIFDTP